VDWRGCLVGYLLHGEYIKPEKHSMISLANVSAMFSEDIGIEGITFDISKGEFVCITGPTGAGKSTILKLIYMDVAPTSGRVTVGEFESSSITRREIPYLRRKVGMIFQDFRLLEDRSVYDNIAFALRATGHKRAEVKKRTSRVIAEVQLTARRNYLPKFLSGGEQQRVAIARALVVEPYVILADEPTGNLDPDTSAEILKLLIKLQRQGTAVVMATHDYSLIEGEDFRIIKLENGQMQDE